MRRFAATTLTLIVPFGARAAPAQTPEGIEVRQGLGFAAGEKGPLALHLYLPPRAAAPRPVVLVFAGPLAEG